MVTATIQLAKEVKPEVEQSSSDVVTSPITAYYINGYLTDEEIEQLKKSDFIDDVVYSNGLISVNEENVLINGKSASQIICFKKMDSNNQQLNQIDGGQTKVTDKKEKTITLQAVNYAPSSFRNDYECKTGDTVKINGKYKQNFIISNFYDDSHNPFERVSFVYVSENGYDALDNWSCENQNEIVQLDMLSITLADGVSFTKEEFNDYLKNTVKFEKEADEIVIPNAPIHYNDTLSKIIQDGCDAMISISITLLIAFLCYRVITSMEESHGENNIIKRYGIPYMIVETIAGIIGTVVGWLLATAIEDRYDKSFLIQWENAHTIQWSVVLVVGTIGTTSLLIVLKAIWMKKYSLNKWKIKGYLFSFVSIAIILILVTMDLSNQYTNQVKERMNVFSDNEHGYNIQIDYGEYLELKDEVEQAMEEVTDIRDEYIWDNDNKTEEKYELPYVIVDDADEILNVYQVYDGKLPSTSDEVLVSESLSYLYDMSDSKILRVTIDGEEKTFKIAGYYHNLKHFVPEFIMLQQTKSSDTYSTYNYRLVDGTKADTVKLHLQALYGNQITIDSYADGLDEAYQAIDKVDRMVYVVAICECVLFLLFGFELVKRVTQNVKKNT